MKYMLGAFVQVSARICSLFCLLLKFNCLRNLSERGFAKSFREVDICEFEWISVNLNLCVKGMTS